MRNSWRLYEYINKIPYETWHFYMHFQHAERVISWSEKKTKKLLKKLLKDGIIKETEEADKRYYPTPWQEFIDPEVLKGLHKAMDEK